MSDEISKETDSEKLIGGEKLLMELWDDDSRPSIQWLRQHTGKDIPAVKVGRLYFYNPAKVRAALQAA